MNDLREAIFSSEEIHSFYKWLIARHKKLEIEFKDKNFTILSISLDDDKESWKAAINADGLVWNHGSELMKWESPIVKKYKFEGIPFNVLIDPAGKVIATELTGDALRKKLTEVLK